MCENLKKNISAQKVQRKLAGLLPIFYLGTRSRYSYLYRDTEARRLAKPGEKVVSPYKLCIMARVAIVS